MCNDKFQFVSGSCAEPAKVALTPNGALIIERNAQTLEAAKRLSDYLNTLDNLTSEQHNRLVELMIDNLKEAEKGAFLAGADIAAATISDNKSGAASTKLTQ